MDDVIKSKVVSVQRTSFGQNANLGYSYDLDINIDALGKKINSLTCRVNRQADENTPIKNLGHIEFVKEKGTIVMAILESEFDNMDIHIAEFKRFINEANVGIED